MNNNVNGDKLETIDSRVGINREKKKKKKMGSHDAGSQMNVVV